MRSLLASLSFALVIATAPAQAIVASTTGIPDPARVVDFGANVLTNFAPATNQFPGVTITNASYFTIGGSSLGITGGFLTQILTSTSSTVRLQFAAPVTDASFVYHQVGTGSPSTIRALLAGVVVDSFSGTWSQYQPNNVFGFTNLVFDEIVLASVNPYELSDWGNGNARYDESIGAFPLGELQFNNDDATLRQLGAELGIRVFPVRGLDVYANYAIHDTSPRSDAAYQDNPIRARDQRTSMHKINVGVQYRSPFGLDVNVDLHWVSDQRWVEQVTDTLRGVRFEEFPLDGYVMLNARLGYRLFDDHLEIGVTGTNLTFQKTR